MLARRFLLVAAAAAQLVAAQSLLDEEDFAAPQPRKGNTAKNSKPIEDWGEYTAFCRGDRNFLVLCTLSDVEDCFPTAGL